MLYTLTIYKIIFLAFFVKNGKKARFSVDKYEKRTNIQNKFSRKIVWITKTKGVKFRKIKENWYKKSNFIHKHSFFV